MDEMDEMGEAEVAQQGAQSANVEGRMQCVVTEAMAEVTTEAR